MFSRSDSMGNYAQWQKVDIPHTWNAEDTDDETPGYFRDKCMYKKSVVIPASKSKERVFLYFEGANQETTLWVNGRQVGNHRGGYAVMVIETDSEIPEESIEWLRHLEGVIKVTYLSVE